MKKSLFLVLLVAVIIWLAFASVLLGIYQPSWLPTSFLALGKPKNLADFGQAFSALDGLISSFALMLGLMAILIQTKQSSDSNIIGALSARQQFLLADYDRLEQQLQDLKNKQSYDKNLFDNMVAKKKRQLDETKLIDEKLKKLLDKV